MKNSTNSICKFEIKDIKFNLLSTNKIIKFSQENLSVAQDILYVLEEKYLEVTPLVMGHKKIPDDLSRGFLSKVRNNIIAALDEIKTIMEDSERNYGATKSVIDLRGKGCSNIGALKRVSNSIKITQLGNTSN